MKLLRAWLYLPGMILELLAEARAIRVALNECMTHGGHQHGRKAFRTDTPTEY